MMVNMACRIPRLLSVLIVGLLLTSCASKGTEPGAATETTAPQPGPAVEEYLHILLPGFAARKELDQLDPELYASLVGRFREGGLEALTEADKGELLLVAQMAFLSDAGTVRWSVTSADAAADAEPSHDGEATIEETFVRGLYSPWGTVSHLAARRAAMDGICWSWGMAPYWDPECRGELRLFVDFVSGEQRSEGDTAIVTQWVDIGGQWMCYLNASDSSYRYYAAELDYWGLFVGITKAILSGHDTLDGQPAYRFEDHWDRSWQYWLDAETLWLRQYEYERDGIRYTVKLEAVNEDIRIEPPDVDVPCVEETLPP
jgi:hypothetical protein